MANPSVAADRVVANAYQYDQLNRINSSFYNKYNGYTTGTWTAGGNAFGTSYSYDMNGNIRTLNRFDGTGTQFDQLSYGYNEIPPPSGSTPGTPCALGIQPANRLCTNNQLNYVQDGITSNTTYDIHNEAINNYTYDAIGNLISDNSENNMQVTWNVYGKIKTIQKGLSSPYTYMAFTYDGAGNRTTKYVGTITSGGVITWTDMTTYVRDASGNIMVTYDDKQISAGSPGGGSGQIHTPPMPAIWSQTSEYPIYGSSRIGVYTYANASPFILQSINADPASWFGSYQRLMQKKDFELDDHLGNVMAVVSDWKVGISDANSNLLYYATDVASATDYYPFEMQMPGRLYNNATYRFGFNGKEMDNETYGNGNSIDYGARINDPRLGRFLSVDPLTRKYPYLTPYQFASNTPIWAIDLDGLEKVIYTLTKANGTWTTSKLELATAGSLGNGVLVKWTKPLASGVVETDYFYGDAIPAGDGANFTKAFEDKNLNAQGQHVAYQIPGEAFTTIGYGHANQSAADQASYPLGTTISEAQAQQLYTDDRTQRDIGSVTGLTQNKLDALNDYGFNAASSGNGMLSIYNGADNKDENFFLDHSLGGAGLWKRRAAEYILFKDAKYIHLDYSSSSQDLWKQKYDAYTTPSTPSPSTTPGTTPTTTTGTTPSTTPGTTPSTTPSTTPASTSPNPK